ncbi:MAG: Smr/MutS family protein [Desulfobacterales bacterium]|nr:Smr/MutS family protein [Desulfobacterales bacterium]
MKPSKSSGLFRPFENLADLLRSRSFEPVTHTLDKPLKKFEAKPDRKNEQKLFMEAMADVKPISKANRLENTIRIKPPQDFEIDLETETLLRLKNLINRGEGFVVADTSEYIEGIGHKINPEIARRLHKGEFSIQTHIDLHGLNAGDAQNTFERFIKEAIITGKRAVLIVHGRGLSSPSKPVLKAKVIQWLTRGPWRKWVIAYTSARPCDGGTGGTYVLLRHRPLTKRFRKIKRSP